jgi:hypothetical protein
MILESLVSEPQHKMHLLRIVLESDASIWRLDGHRLACAAVPRPGHHIEGALPELVEHLVVLDLAEVVARALRRRRGTGFLGRRTLAGRRRRGTGSLSRRTHGGRRKGFAIASLHRDGRCLSS